MTAAPPLSRQPWLHERVIGVHGPTTSLSDTTGGMGAAGTGLFVDDRRVLSVLDLRLGGQPPVAVVSSAAGGCSQFLACARNLGAAGPDPTIEVHRSRTADLAGMTERIEIVSRADEEISTTLAIRVAGDGADIATVKAGLAAARPLPATAQTEGVSWADDRHLTRLTTRPAPTNVLADDVGALLEFPLSLPGRSTWSVDLRVTTTRTSSTTFDVGAGGSQDTWRDVTVMADDTRLNRAVETSMQDLRGLLLTDPQEPADVFCAAGTPWYLTLFGRDSLWAARLMLPFGTELAAGTLRALARRQGTMVDAASAQEPGKILHEVRRATEGSEVAFDDPSAGLKLPPVYYGSVDATALWLCLLVEAWRHGMPEHEVRELLPNARAAFGWLQQASAVSPDGLLRYRDTTGQGLANQGWKDSEDSMRRADGTVAPAPIALVEAQGYAAQAARSGAQMLRALQEPGAQEWDDYANAMQDRIRQHYWAGSTLAMAVDGEGRLVDGVGSNMGHLLGTGILGDDESAHVVACLTGPDMLGEFGISTLSRSNPGYNPLGYHTGSVWTHDSAICALGLARQGFAAEASAVARALVHAASWFDGRWPELYSGSALLGAPAPYPAACRPQGWSAASAGALITVALGLNVDVPQRQVRIRPARPLPFGAMTVAGLRFGQHRFSVGVAVDGVVTVDGLPGDVHVDIPNP